MFWLLLFIGIFVGYIIYKSYNTLTYNRKAFTKEELDAMSREMVGKSKNECRQILKNHSHTILDDILRRK